MVLYTDLINPLFLAVVPAVGLVSALLGLGGVGLSALFNRKSQADKDAQAAQTTLARQQGKLAKARGGRETTLFNQSQPIIGQLTSQLQALLSGDREALTQRFAPSLNRLAGQREGATRRIQESGPASGAQVQSLLELEKQNFASQSELLASAPAEAQAGLQQLLQLLLGGAASQGAGADRSAAISSDALTSIQASEQRNRFLNADSITQITSAASGFGKSLFKSKNPFIQAPGGTIGDLTGAPKQGTIAPPAGMFRKLLEGLEQ